MNKKAIFVVGGPGSGKDILLKTSLKYLPEFKIEQLAKALNHQFVIISSSAFNYDKLLESKSFLEYNHFETAMIFVHVSPEVSKSRFIKNNTQDSVNILEYKYNTSVGNLYKFFSVFEDFLKFDNDLIFEDKSQFHEVEQFCKDFLTRGYFTEKKNFKSRKSKLEKSTDIITADNLMQGNMDRIQPSPDYSVKFEDYMPFSYSGYPDVPVISGDSRISPGEPDSYENKSIRDMKVIPMKSLDKIKKIRKEHHGKRINK